MNQYILLRRMCWPMMLLIFGITAILNEYTGIGYDRSWPLYLIAWGVLKLAENAILAQTPPAAPPYPGYPGTGPGAPGTYPGSYQGAPGTIPGSYPGTVPGTGMPGAPSDPTGASSTSQEGR